MTLPGVALLAAAFVAHVLLHEAAHILAGWLKGARPRLVSYRAVTYDQHIFHHVLTARDRAVIAAAGPAATALLTLASLALVVWTPEALADHRLPLKFATAFGLALLAINCDWTMMQTDLGAIRFERRHGRYPSDAETLAASHGNRWCMNATGLAAMTASGLLVALVP